MYLQITFVHNKCIIDIIIFILYRFSFHYRVPKHLDPEHRVVLGSFHLNESIL